MRIYQYQIDFGFTTSNGEEYRDSSPSWFYSKEDAEMSIELLRDGKNKWAKGTYLGCKNASQMEAWRLCG